MRLLAFKIYKQLLEQGALSKSNIPKSVWGSDTFKGLLDAGILRLSKVGRGLKITVDKKSDFDSFFKTRFPEDAIPISKSGNIRKFRDSKATKIELSPIFLFRGFGKVTINNLTVDLKYYTQNFGLFVATPTSIVCENICFVENLESFLKTEKLLGKKFLFIHKYGRIGATSLSAFQPEGVILVFVDYDFNGLDEYLRIKRVFKNARLFVPDNYDELFKKYSKTLKGNKAKMSKAVRSSEDPVVVKIREEVIRNNRFLEQEILIHD